jgi:hypothetical protein
MNRDRLKFFLWTLAALSAGLLLRLFFVVHLSRIAGDTLLYGDIAKTWLQHGIYGFTETNPTPGSILFRPTLIRLPGYPLFLAICFRLFGMEHYNAVLYAQVVADLLTCWFASALAGCIFGRRARLPVLWIAALCPFTANYVAVPLTETLVLTTIALALYAFARWQAAALGFNRWLWITASAIAYSILLRPDQGLLAAAILPAMLYSSLATRERRARPLRSALPVLAAALCVVLPLVPWTIRNERTFHVFQPLAPRYANDPGEQLSLGFARWYRTWAIEYTTNETVYWNYPGNRIELSDLPSRAFDAGSPAATADLRRRTATLLADYNRNSVATPAFDARFAALARERVYDHPILCRVGMPAARLLNMAFRPRTEMMPLSDDWWSWSDHPEQSAYAYAYAALNFACFVLALTGLYRWRRHAWFASDSGPHDNRALVLAMAAYFLLRSTLLLTIDNSEPRYTLEFFPILFVWIASLFTTPPQITQPPSSSPKLQRCP